MDKFDLKSVHTKKESIKKKLSSFSPIKKKATT